ncbi:MAG: hypothetical protein R2756_03310 [Bacteroidales bacterium]
MVTPARKRTLSLLTNPFILAAIVPSANSIRISGHLDCFIATCKPSVLSRILGISSPL